MIYYDVFNGDADGILSLVQLRKAQPKKSKLVTGVKRNIELLKQVPCKSGNSITVLDISMEKNHQALVERLDAGCEIFYADHHRSGDIPKYDHLTALIDLSANTCTGLIINQYLKGSQVLWAIAAAYGDNMIASANQLANSLGLTQQQQSELQNFGTLINYNGYGEVIADLYIAPDKLFNILMQYDSPFDCIKSPGSIYHQLNEVYQSDLANAQNAKVLEDNDGVHVIQLDDQPWAKRISGVFGNILANQYPNKAIIVVTENTPEQVTSIIKDNQSDTQPTSSILDNKTSAASLRVSLRAPINNKQGAGEICSQFDTGGGREAAAGINVLPVDKLSHLISVVEKHYR